MSDLARSEPRNSRSAGGARLPVLGAAGGNVGFAVHAKRSAQTTSIQRVDVVRCSYAPRDNACRIVVPRAKTSLSKLLTHRDKIRNGQGHATPLPQDGQETPPSAMIGMPRRTSLRLPCHCANMNSVAPGTGSRLPGSRRLQRPSPGPDRVRTRGSLRFLYEKPLPPRTSALIGAPDPCAANSIKEHRDEVDHARASEGGSRSLPMAYQEVRRSRCRIHLRAVRSGNG